jgi:hypothetical protein
LGRELEKESTMTRRILYSGLLFAMGTLPLVGCGTEPSGDGSTADGSHVVLEAAFGTSGALIVSEDAEGNLNTVVQGRIGVDDQSIMQRISATTSLEDAFKVLNPAATSTPANLHAISERLQAQKAASIAQSPLPLMSQVSPTTDLNKSATTFNNTACQTFSGGFSAYVPEYCSYQYGWSGICTFSTINPADRSYAWNESGTAGYQYMNGMSWKPAVPAWTWQYAQWGGSYSNRYACLYLNGGATGNIGVTWHQLVSTDEHLVGVSGP